MFDRIALVLTLVRRAPLAELTLAAPAFHAIVRLVL
jgi:hypothetical protein